MKMMKDKHGLQLLLQTVPYCYNHLRYNIGKGTSHNNTSITPPRPSPIRDVYYIEEITNTEYTSNSAEKLQECICHNHLYKIPVRKIEV